MKVSDNVEESIVSFNVDEFPRLLDYFYSPENKNNKNWIIFLRELGYNFRWNHYASKKKYVEMNESEFVMFALKWK